MKLEELAKSIGAEVVGDGSVEITSAATLEGARSGQISFLTNPKYIKQLQTTQASAVVVSPGVKIDTPVALLKTKDPYYAFRQAIVLLHGYRKHPHAGIHPQAHVDSSASVGEGSILYPGVYVGPRATVGRDCILYPNVVVYDDCVVGDRVTLHAGVVIGQDGFGYATHKGLHHKIPQTGNAIIEDDVELGANCCIDRATLGSTVIGRGTKMGNLVNFGHGSKIGSDGLLVGLIGIAGSATIGHHATIGGHSGVAGHLKLGNGVTIGAHSGVMTELEDQVTVLGAPAMPASHARRVYSIFTNLPEVLDRIKQLEQQVAALGGDKGASTDAANVARKLEES